jgi:hypothetical protein
MMNAITIRKVNPDVNKFKHWLEQQNEHRHRHEILSAQLDLYFALFMVAKKLDGDFEPDTLKYIQGSINICLTGNILQEQIINTFP